MGALRKAGVWLGLVEDDESRDYERAYERSYERAYSEREGDAKTIATKTISDDDLEFGDDYEEPAPARPVARQGHGERMSGRDTIRIALRPVVGTLTASRTSPALLTQDNLALAPQVALRERAVVSEESKYDSDSEYRITTLHPKTYNEARTIGEHFRNGIPVIMNLTEMDESDAKSLVDFAAGLIFGLRGSIDRVTNRVFLLSPANVSVTAEDKARIAEGRFFNQS